MQQAKSLVKVLTIVVCLGMGLIWMTTADSMAGKIYEIDTNAVLDSYYYGDTGRVGSAYEQLNSQYLTLIQNQLNRTNDDLYRGGQKLEAIEKKLDAIAARLGRIEKALKITDEAKPASRTEKSADKPVGAESYPARSQP